ncbi:hypothetical protein ORL49_15650 [Klebsiella michiganensis]|uniref:hypothetical protein n=1 Tax=Klebsiella michiganensis TaxID=1134687 RepID=UPI0015BE6EFD|nr:hypothetical protein [Klebsiella michiganensis]MCW9516116.1 hypothetical protein [Klebsiella michiganensis]NWN29344.1 hypothetical protein [Klebsiella michiganensis]
MLYLYEATLPEDNNDSEVKRAYEISPIEKDGYIASFNFNKPEEASQAVDSWLASQGVLSQYIVNAV